MLSAPTRTLAQCALRRSSHRSFAVVTSAKQACHNSFPPMRPLYNVRNIRKHPLSSSTKPPPPPPSPSPTPTPAAAPAAPGHTKRGPVSWTSLGLVAVTSAIAVAYFRVQRERRLEEAMGKIVSSESEGWSPDPGSLAPRKFRKEPDGRWFPERDMFGGSGKLAIGGPWTLINLNGKLISEKTYQGKFTLLYFGFARCPDICPSEMVKVGKVMDTLQSKYPEYASLVQPLFVTVDPARDSIQALQSYGKDFHPSYEFLTGTPEQVQKMAKLYRVYVSKADESDDGDYLVDHSIVLYLHDEEGELVDVCTQSMKPSDVVDRIVGVMGQRKKKVVEGGGE